MTKHQQNVIPAEGLTEPQLAGIACVGCGAADCPLYDAGLARRVDGIVVRHYPVMKCRPCMPDRQMIVIASSDPRAAGR
ncbi:hypothetical protein BX265_6211 [Streptomyces sp. TLI_235]|nr:hypothetical protein [Streptomyces sp. TLI_235]PBC71601.1 hypothetical protein BX265_6211 [Streptomyces sp. TLI_235]